MGRIVVTGSVAFDTIMEFPGRFGDHILPDQTQRINVSFLVTHLEQRRGGTAANIAHTLALLGERPLLCAGVGGDFGDYGAALQASGIDISGVQRHPDLATASGFITTDSDGNQLTAFFAGAMERADVIDITRHDDVEHVVIAADAPPAMEAHIDQACGMGAKLVFAPAQQIPSLSDDTLRRGMEAAWLVSVNAYEMELLRARTGLPLEELRDHAIVAVTRGRDGSVIHSADGEVAVPVAPVDRIVDPTGAGDAYLAGLLAALRRGAGLEVAGRVAALAAAYVVELGGTQSHTYGTEEFAHRYRSAFGEPLVWA